MKKLLLYLPILVLSLGMITSCNDQEENIVNAMFYDDGSAGGGGGNNGGDKDDDGDLVYSVELSYDADINNFQEQDNGRAEWNEIVGLEFFLQNTTSSTITDISVQISSFSPSTIISDYTEDAATLDFLSAFSMSPPDTYWCFNCDTVNEIRIGNFYIVTPNRSGSVDLTINYYITYTKDGVFNSESFSQTIEIN